MNILILDDERSWRTIVARWLNNEGYNCDVADDIQSALKLLNSKSYKLGIIDISLSRSESLNDNGLQVVEYILKNHTNTKIIILTGFSLRGEHLIKRLSKEEKERIEILEKICDGFALKMSIMIEKVKELV